MYYLDAHRFSKINFSNASLTLRDYEIYSNLIAKIVIIVTSQILNFLILASCMVIVNIVYF